MRLLGPPLLEYLIPDQLASTRAACNKHQGDRVRDSSHETWLRPEDRQGQKPDQYETTQTITHVKEVERLSVLPSDGMIAV